MKKNKKKNPFPPPHPLFPQFTVSVPLPLHAKAGCSTTFPQHAQPRPVLLTPNSKQEVARTWLSRAKSIQATHALGPLAATGAPSPHLARLLSPHVSSVAPFLLLLSSLDFAHAPALGSFTRREQRKKRPVFSPGLLLACGMQSPEMCRPTCHAAWRTAPEMSSRANFGFFSHLISLNLKKIHV